MMQQQAIAIGESFLRDPAALGGRPNPTTPPNTGRASWDLVDQYYGLVRSSYQFGAAHCLLEQLTVQGGQRLPVECPGGVPATDARRVDITVTYPPSASVHFIPATGPAIDMRTATPAGPRFTLVELVITIAVGAGCASWHVSSSA